MASLEMLQASHFYKGFDWEAVLSMSAQAPLAPYVQGRMPANSRGSGSNSGSLSSSHRATSHDLMSTERSFAVFMDTKACSAVDEQIDTSSVALCDAAARGDLSALRSIKDAGGYIDMGDYDQRTAAHLAASNGLLPVLKFLIEDLGAKHSPVDRWGATPLDDARRHEHEGVLEYLVSIGAKRGKVDCSSTALCTAASTGDFGELQAICDAGGDMNLGDYDQRTAMHLSASEGWLKVVSFLVNELHADHSPLDRWGGTPLDDALRQNHSAVVEYLVRCGAVKGCNELASVDISSTACCAAASRGDADALRVVHRAGGDVSKGDYDGRTAMHLAACEGRLAIIELLVDELGADHSPVDRWGNTPLDDARRCQQAAVVAFLEAKGATSLCIDMSAFVLCSAAFAGNVDSLAKISDTGGCLDHGDYDRRTALHVAAAEGRYEAVAFLLERGVNPNPCDRFGGTPLDDATRQGHTSVRQLLIERGGHSGSDVSEIDALARDLDL